ncbi:L-2-amino-thiazoline-4-carboxylic acid hydrolase [Curtanaerobium respiraculi]|uniref:L-2-amino-thiazoline-4-carboxylic acid hydrolase n=1 Tax=Curtanaerobium respiraculi TaxID=2949669 RepID=UPI0024B3C5DC|nr:L-2-amino-thiazoline-4-carboxylic acid hydrolase [Curtanaerobium respiraculi]
MKYTMKLRGIGWFFGRLVRGAIPKPVRNEVSREYAAILRRAKPMSQANLLASYAMGAYFIAMSRNTGLSPEENYLAIERGFMGSGIVRRVLGAASGSYLDASKMEERKLHAAESHELRGENNWVYDIVEPDGTFAYGLDYTACGICLLCQDEGVPELTPYLCRLDFPMAEMMGVRLTRTKTIGGGDDVCDFRYSLQSDMEGPRG